MSQPQQSNYYIKQLNGNSKNANQYIYVDSVYGSIETSFNQWHFKLNVWIISNSNLPVNTYLMSVNTQIFEVDNICLFKKEFVDVDSFVKQPEFAQLWTVDFFVDTKNSNLNTMELNNFKLPINFKFSINAEALNGQEIDYVGNAADIFISEMQMEEVKTDISYTNYNCPTNKVGVISVANLYDINTNYETLTTAHQLRYVLPVLEDLQSPIIEVLNLETEENITIQSIEYDFEYCINNQMKKYTSTDNIEKNFDGEYNVKFENSLLFDSEKNEVIETNPGIIGFYIPVCSSFTYSIKFKMLIDKNFYSFVFNNSGNFLNSDNYFKKIITNHITINSLEGYE